MKGRSFQFLDMTSSEADAYLEQHLAVADEVIGVFRDRLSTVAGVSRDLFDYSTGNLSVIWEAVKPLYADREVDSFGFGSDTPPLWYHQDDPRSGPLPRHLWWIRDGLIHHVSRCLMSRSTALTWDRERDRVSASFNQPTIVGFRDLQMHPIVDVSGMAGGYLYRGLTGKKEPVDSFMSVYGRWVERMPDIGEEPAPPQTDRYGLESVEVSVAVTDEIRYEWTAPDRPEDWEGAWSVWLPEGVDVVCGPNTKEDLAVELAGRPEVRRVGWADEDVMLVDAPDVEAHAVRQVAVSFLRARNQHRND